MMAYYMHKPWLQMTLLFHTIIPCLCFIYIYIYTAPCFSSYQDVIVAPYFYGSTFIMYRGLVDHVIVPIKAENSVPCYLIWADGCVGPIPP